MKRTTYAALPVCLAVALSVPPAAAHAVGAQGRPAPLHVKEAEVILQSSSVQVQRCSETLPPLDSDFGILAQDFDAGVAPNAAGLRADARATQQTCGAASVKIARIPIPSALRRVAALRRLVVQLVQMTQDFRAAGGHLGVVADDYDQGTLGTVQAEYSAALAAWNGAGAHARDAGVALTVLRQEGF